MSVTVISLIKFVVKIISIQNMVCIIKRNKKLAFLLY